MWKGGSDTYSVSIPYDFPAQPAGTYKEHLDNAGTNAIAMYNVAHCWAKNVRRPLTLATDVLGLTTRERLKLKLMMPSWLLQIGIVDANMGITSGGVDFLTFTDVRTWVTAPRCVGWQSNSCLPMLHTC